MFVVRRRWYLFPTASSGEVDVNDEMASEHTHSNLLELLLLEGVAHALEQAHPRVGRGVFL